MKESDFQRWVIAVAEAFGWRVWHVPMPIRPIQGGKYVPEPRARGLPDLIMLREEPEPRMVVAELKSPHGELSKDQVEFIRGAGKVIPAYVWRPGDETEIEAVLK